MALALPMPEAAPVISAARPGKSAAMPPLKRCPVSPQMGQRSSTVILGQGRAPGGMGAIQQDPLVLG